MSTTRLSGLYAAIAAPLALLISPLLALAWFATDDGADALQDDTVAAWAEPTRDLAGSLLTWASPDRVYATYLQLLALLFPAVPLCARAARARRPRPGGRLERWGWRIALTGYALMTVGVSFVAIALIGAAAGGAVNVIFVGLMVPAMLTGLPCHRF
jgi:hypothetical protein